MSALGNSLVGFLWSFIEGFLTSQDTFLSQALGSHDFGIKFLGHWPCRLNISLADSTRYWSYVSIYCTMFLVIIGSLILSLSHIFFLYVIKIEYELALEVLAESPSPIFYFCDNS